MDRLKDYIILFAVIVIFLMTLGGGAVLAENIDPDANGCKYAWSENAGWINFKPAEGPGVTVTDTAVTGMAWGENIGWINLSPTSYGGVVNDGMGILSGYAWGENVGWIKFNPTGGGVIIGSDGKFSGYAWGENIGWINFSASNSCVKTAWVQADITVDPFTLIPQTGVALNTLITSNTITVSGINRPVWIAITGGEYSINNGIFTSLSPTVTNVLVVNGDTVRVRQTSSGSYSTTTNATLTLGGVSGTFSVTTLAVDTTPDPLNFTPQTGVALNTLVTSNTITITGINNLAWIGGITGGEYSINNGIFTSASNTTTFVANGDTVRVRQTSSGSYSTTTNATLTLGGVSGTFSVTTLAVDTTPDPLNFIPQIDVPLSTLVTSNTITITGINERAWIEGITGGEYSINNGIFTSASNTTTFVVNGDTVRVRQTSSGSYSTTTNATLTLGGVSGTFSVTTLPINTDVVSPADPVAVPNAQVDLAFANVTTGGLVTAVPVDPSGLPAPANFVLLGGTAYNITTSAVFSGQITVCIKYDPALLGGVSENDLRLFHYVSGTPQDITQLPVDTVNKKVCGLTSTLSPFAVAAPALDKTPDPFHFIEQTGVPLNTVITSNTITVSGINTPAPISITGGQYSMNGGAFTSAAGTVSNGDNVRVQLTSSGSFGATRTATLAIGSVSGAFSVTTVAIVFSGFFSPVDNLPTVNSAKAGQVVPVKWRLTDASGTPISDPTSFRDLGSYTINCSSLTGDPIDAIEEYAAGASGLQYDGDGYWQFNWKTPKTYAGQCRTMVLTLGDGSKHKADFKFR